MKSKPTEVQYFRDGSKWVASIDMGNKGFFVHHAGDEGWTYLMPGSLRWDSLHQNLYRTGHDYDPCRAGDEKSLPPLPPVPPIKPVQWRDNFLPDHELSADAYPALSACLRSAPDCKLQVWIVLEEDTYETACGDGCFRYFTHTAYLTETDAMVAASTPKDGYTSTIATVVIGLADNAITPSLFEPKVFDHYDFEEVVKATEESLALQSIAANGTVQSRANTGLK